MAKAKDVDTYIATAPKEAQPVLHELRKLILDTVPEAEESISWNVPFYKLNGPLAGFAVYKKHVSFGIANGEIETKDREALTKKGYKTGKKTVQIGFEQKVPVTLFKRIVKANAKNNAKL